MRRRRRRSRERRQSRVVKKWAKLREGGNVGEVLI